MGRPAIAKYNCYPAGCGFERLDEIGARCHSDLCHCQLRLGERHSQNFSIWNVTMREEVKSLILPRLDIERIPAKLHLSYLVAELRDLAPFSLRRSQEMR